MNDVVKTAAEPKGKSIHEYYVRDPELTLRIHTDERVFASLEMEWEKLARKSNQMICMSPGWAACWWKHFGRHENRSLFIVTVYSNLKLVAIFPFYKGITKAGSITLLKRMQLIGSGGSPNEQLGFSDDYGISDFLDLIVDPEYKNRTAAFFAKLLTLQEFADQKIIFHEARDDSFIKQTLYPLLKRKKCNIHAEHTDRCSYIDIEEKDDFQDFIEKSKSNARRRFRQTLRARGLDKDYIIEEPASMQDVEQMIEKLMQLHQGKWNNLGYPGAFMDERFRNFFKEISFSAYREKRLWIKQAVDESGICAVRMLLLYNGRYYDYMSGYNEDSPSAKRRPGIGLLLDLVENSFKQPVKRIELLRGDEGYKHDFTDRVSHNWKITLSEDRSWKTAWGLKAATIQAVSHFHKYSSREKMLLKVQHYNAGFPYMFTEYFKFRMETVLDKINKTRRTG